MILGFWRNDIDPRIDLLHNVKQYVNKKSSSAKGYQTGFTRKISILESKRKNLNSLVSSFVRKLSDSLENKDIIEHLYTVIPLNIVPNELFVGVIVLFGSTVTKVLDNINFENEEFDEYLLGNLNLDALNCLEKMIAELKKVSGELDNFLETGLDL